MRLRTHASRPLLAVMVNAVVLLAGASAAGAATVGAGTVPKGDAVEALPAPVLNSATIKGDVVSLLWTPVEGDVRGYAIHANGDFVFRTLSEDHIPVNLASEGLNGTEEFTVVAEDNDGNPSPPSNGLVPVAPATLPAPELISGDYQDGMVTLDWTPSENDDLSGDIGYQIWADGSGVPNGHALVAQVWETTTATFVPDACGGACPLPGSEVYTVVATDLTMAESPPSNGLMVPRDE